jgi:hemerythrin
MKKYEITDGVYLLEIAKVDLRILCGCPMDIVKHLMKSGHIQIIDDESIEVHRGPNAILLSDSSFQNGELCNLTEFPLLHMLYKQGMLVDGHPGFGGRPWVLGIPEQIQGQREYLRRCVNGLSEQEIEQVSDLSTIEKEYLLAIKRRFKADGEIDFNKIVNFLSIDKNEEPYPFLDDVEVVRLGLNVYLFQYQDQQEIIDLNLTIFQHYGVPYSLGYHAISRRDFSIVHNGDGNGWDMDRPCMGSLLSINGLYYLIDVGPNIIESLHHLGISLHEIEGVFLTHTHDDHFAGLPTVLCHSKKIKFFSTQLIRQSAISKLGSLMNFDEDLFNHFFEVHTLQLDQWQDVGHFEVRPFLSPHPVENTIFYFRKKTGDGYRSYGHLADTISLRVHQQFINTPSAEGRILAHHYDDVWNAYLRTVNVKKVDVNSGLIHGDPIDYFDDKSGKVIFSHTQGLLPEADRQYASTTVFGAEDILIDAEHDYLSKLAQQFVSQAWDFLKSDELRIVLMQRKLLISAGTLIARAQSPVQDIYLVLSGVVEVLHDRPSDRQELHYGCFFGEEEVLTNQNYACTYRAVSYVRLLKIPLKIYQQFFSIHSMHKLAYLHNLQLRGALQSNYNFKNVHDRIFLDKILARVRYAYYKTNDILKEGEMENIGFLTEGMVGVFYKETLVETLADDGFYGYEKMLKIKQRPSIVALSDVKVMYIPMAIMMQYPLLLWKITETADKMDKLIKQTERLLENGPQSLILTMEPTINDLSEGV